MYAFTILNCRHVTSRRAGWHMSLSELFSPTFHSFFTKVVGIFLGNSQMDIPHKLNVGAGFLVYLEAFLDRVQHTIGVFIEPVIDGNSVLEVTS
ncbi:MAG: hypothetical protein ABIP74_00705 [Candidatus Saccharimonas sp.]